MTTYTVKFHKSEIELIFAALSKFVRILQQIDALKGIYAYMYPNLPVMETLRKIFSVPGKEPKKMNCMYGFTLSNLEYKILSDVLIAYSPEGSDLAYQTTKKYEEYLPEVGLPCTMGVGSDRYPYRITRVSPSGKTFWMKPVAYHLKSGFTTYGSENQEYVFGDVKNEVVETRVSFRKYGGWVDTSDCPVGLGHYDAYSDPSF